MESKQNNEERILTINGEAVTAEIAEDRKEQLKEEKAKLETMLKDGEIDGTFSILRFSKSWRVWLHALWFIASFK